MVFLGSLDRNKRRVIVEQILERVFSFSCSRRLQEIVSGYMDLWNWDRSFNDALIRWDTLDKRSYESVCKFP